MKITHQTADELVLSCSALNSRILYGLLVAFGGGMVLLALGLCLALQGIPVLPKPVGSFWYNLPGMVFLVLVGLAFGVPGAVTLARQRGVTYDFQGRSRQLVVRSKRGEECIPFAKILRAEVQMESSYHSSMDVFGLCLILRDPPRQVQCTDVLTQERRSKAVLAEQINRFLEQHHESNATTKA